MNETTEKIINLDNPASSPSPARALEEGALQTGAGLDLPGLAMLGKTAFALGVVLLIILGAARLVKRRQQGSGSVERLQVVNSVAVGPKEKVVCVDAEGMRLVLGVAGGNITLLHKAISHDHEGTPETPSTPTDHESGNEPTHDPESQQSFPERLRAHSE